MDRPWFKFTSTNWLSGSVQLLDAAEKGTYIDLIAMIWKEGGKLENTKILHRKLRLDNATACDRINSYCDLDILVCENNFLSIKFLDDQIDSYKTTCDKNSKNAAKRWDKETKPMRPDANKKRREEKREEKNIKTKPKKFIAPTLKEVMEFFKEKGYSESSAVKAFDYYTLGDWIDAKGNQVKNWKQKMNGVWFKDENKVIAKNANPFAGGMN